MLILAAIVGFGLIAVLALILACALGSAAAQEDERRRRVALSLSAPISAAALRERTIPRIREEAGVRAADHRIGAPF